MASRFDPSAFIEAEEKQALARAARVASVAAASLKPAEICHSSPAAPATIAGIATIARSVPKTPWSALVSRFINTPRPAYVSEEKWDELTGEAESVELRWGEIAYQAGWGSMDLYACPPDPLSRRYGQSGLVDAIVGLLTPVKIVALDSKGASLRPFKGPDMRFNRSIRAGAVHLWEAYRPTAGP